jgi:hypothetical protein
MALRGYLIAETPEQGGGGAFNRRGPIVRLGCAKIVSGGIYGRHDDWSRPKQSLSSSRSRRSSRRRLDCQFGLQVTVIAEHACAYETARTSLSSKGLTVRRGSAELRLRERRFAEQVRGREVGHRPSGIPGSITRTTPGATRVSTSYHDADLIQGGRHGQERKPGTNKRRQPASPGPAQGGDRRVTGNRRQVRQGRGDQIRGGLPRALGAPQGCSAPVQSDGASASCSPHP